MLFRSEENMINDAKNIINLAKKNNVDIPLPIDVVCGINADATNKDINEVLENELIKDIGPKTSLIYKKYIEEAGTIIWNGPVGVF